MELVPENYVSEATRSPIERIGITKFNDNCQWLRSPHFEFLSNLKFKWGLRKEILKPEQGKSCRMTPRDRGENSCEIAPGRTPPNPSHRLPSSPKKSTPRPIRPAQLQPHPIAPLTPSLSRGDPTPPQGCPHPQLPPPAPPRIPPQTQPTTPKKRATTPTPAGPTTGTFSPGG